MVERCAEGINEKHPIISLATDEPRVLQEEAKEFADYKFFGDATAAARANSLSTRYADGSLLALLTDVILVSQSQYIVCTFSSQVCRLSYELMQVDITRVFVKEPQTTELEIYN